MIRRISTSFNEEEDNNERIIRRDVIHNRSSGYWQCILYSTGNGDCYICGNDLWYRGHGLQSPGKEDLNRSSNSWIIRFAKNTSPLVKWKKGDNVITLLIIAVAIIALIVVAIVSAATVLLPAIDIAIAILVIYGLYKVFHM